MKKILYAVIAAMLLATGLAFGTAAQEQPISLTVNGYPVDCSSYEKSVYLKESNLPVFPLQAFTDGAGIEMEYDEISGTVTVTAIDYDVRFTIGKAEYTKNGTKLIAIIPPFVENGVVYIAVDTAQDAFDAVAKYNSEKGYVVIHKVFEKLNDEKPSILKVENTQKGGWHEFTTVVSAMNTGFVTTLKLFAITLLGALPLGLIICLCSISKIKPIKWVTKFLVWVIRGTPLMLQLLIIYYVPGIAMGGNSPWPSGESGKFLAASIAFILNYAFYFSEIFRGGIESIPQGQIEAGQVLGMTKTQIFFNVTLMQMVKRVVPPMSNEIITLVKDTSIARIISLQEVIWAGYAFLKSSHGYSGLLWPIFFTGVYYLLFNGILTILFGYIEKKLSYYKG